MARGANPVFYLQNAKQGIVNTNLQTLVENRNLIPGLSVFLSYIKGMSTQDGETQDGEDFDCYDEMEWRIVGCKLAGSCAFRMDGDQFILDFQPQDVEILIFPDSETRQMALADDKIQVFFDRKMPMMLDATDLGNI